MKTKLSFFFSTLLVTAYALSSCGIAKTDGPCIDELKINDGMCTMQYDPVCGCDGKTYSNACVAGRAGVSSSIMGECGEE